MALSEISKKTLSIIIKISISLALLIFLFRQVDRKVIFEIIRSANLWLLLVALSIYIMAYIMCFFRWKMLIKAVEVHIPIKRIIIAFCGGLFFNVFLPSTIGGDLIRSFDLATHTRKAKEIVATVLLDRLSGYTAMVLIAVVAMMLGYGLIRDIVVFFIVASIVLILALILLLIFNDFFFSKINAIFHSPVGNRLMNAIRDTHQEMYYFKRRKRILLFSLFYSLVVQLSAPLAFYIIGLALGVKASAIYFFMFFSLITVITMLPISIGGLGLRDATTIYFFAKIGMAKDLAFAISIMIFFFTLLLGAIGGIVYVFALHTRRLQHH